MKLVGDGVEEQAEQVMRNMEAILSAAGCTFEDVVKTTILCAFLERSPQHATTRAERGARAQAHGHQGLCCGEHGLRAPLPFQPAGALHVRRLCAAAGRKGGD